MNLQTFISNGIDYPMAGVRADRELVRQIQDHLNKLGFNAGLINGVWGKQTHDAFAQFKAKNDLTAYKFTPQVAQTLLQTTPVPQGALTAIASHADSISSARLRPVPPPPPSRLTAFGSSRSLLATPIAAPATRRVINAEGLALIKAYEILKLKVHICPAGLPIVGYGSIARGELGQKITVDQAEALLLSDLEKFAAAIDRVVTVPLTSNQFSALICFVFNVGGAAFNNSTLLKRLNQGDYQGAANQFLRWNRAGGKVLPELVQRRQAERTLFLT